MTALAAASLLAALLAAGSSALLIRLLRPLLLRYALARPNARSSHRVPTPQGGGIAVVGATLAVACAVSAVSGEADARALTVLVPATLALALLGLVDDIRPLPTLPRLAVQALAVAALAILASPGRILPETIPLGIERALVVLAGLWWVNLVNFMDGIDGMTVVGTGPLTAAAAAIGLAGVIPAVATILSAALLGGLLGFAPSNRPVARLFLGDVGSLPIGLLTGWLLLALAASGGLAAALLVSLYYVADATLTLLRRARRGEAVWQAHRQHFYQRALDNGFSVMAVDARVLMLNLSLAALAGTTLAWPTLPVVVAALAAGLVLVGLTLGALSRPRSPGAGARSA